MTGAVPKIAAAFACASSLALANAGCASPPIVVASNASPKMRAVSVSADGRSVTALEAGVRVTILSACAREKFMPDRTRDPANPRLSPDGRYVLVERVWPFEPNGRVDESTVLYDAVKKRSYVSSAFEPRLGVTGADDLAWVKDRPSTLQIFSSGSTKAVALPGPLENVGAFSRCPQ